MKIGGPAYHDTNLIVLPESPYIMAFQDRPDTSDLGEISGTPR